jgi:type II secretory pathway component GspD/PulD (secretin)
VVVTVKPEVSNIVDWKGLGGKYPQVRSREAQASVRVNDGETFVLGGLLSDEETNTVNKVPVLSKIPVMGGLFKSETKETSHKEIVITITPRIIK